MPGAPPFEKIEFFLRSVFDFLDRYTEFTERPMADERSWIGVNAPIVQLIFLDDVVDKIPIQATYVTLFVTGQVFTLEQYVDACVKVLQSLREEDLPEVIINYVNMLVDVYAKANSIKTMLPESQFASEPDGFDEEIMKPEKLIERSTADNPDTESEDDHGD